MIPIRTLGHRAPLLWLVLPYMAGAAAERHGPEVPPLPLLMAGLGAAALALLMSFIRPRLWAPFLVAGLALAGYADCARVQGLPPGWRKMPAREARFTLRIERTFEPATTSFGAPRIPAFSPRSGKTSQKKVPFSPASGTGIVTGADRHLSELVGQRVYYSLGLRSGQSAPGRSAVVSASGVLNIVPRESKAESFEAFLSGIGVNLRLDRGQLLGIVQPQSAYRRFCDGLAARMKGILGAGFESRPDLSSVYGAMLLGRKQDLTAGQKSAFLRSGTMHLFAINGLHIGVVAVALNALLALFRCPRLAAALAVLAVLWLDVDTTGASPSAVRAFLMVCVVEGAHLAHRPANLLAALAAAALPFLLYDPMDLYGASFQMSYGVMAAIVMLGIPLAGWLQARLPACRHVPHPLRSRIQRWRAVAQRHALGALGVGLAAALVGAISGVRFFGVLAPAGLPIGIIVAPLAMLVIVAGFLSIFAGLAGSVLPGKPFAGPAARIALSSFSGASRFLNGAASVLLRMITGAVSAGLRVPGGNYTAHFRAAWIGPAALAALIAVCMAGYAGRWRRKVGYWWAPFAVVFLALVFGVRFGVPSSP
jgi:competence protein ComEC